MKSIGEQMKFIKEEKMTIDSHLKGSEKDQNIRKKKENAKENGIWKHLTDEEYEREKAEIEVHLELLMELLHINNKD